MPKSFYLSGKFLDAVYNNTPYVSPAVVYVALYTTAPTLVTPGVEVSGGGYGRQTATWSAPSSGQLSNTTAIVFPVATAAWGTVVAFGVFDASSGGNLLYFNNLSAPRVVDVSDQLVIPVSQAISSEGLGP